MAFDKSENQEWPFARILVLGKFSVKIKDRITVPFVLTYWRWFIPIKNSGPNSNNAPWGCRIDTMGWVPWDVSHEVGPTWGVEWVLWDGSHGVGMQWVPGGVNLYL